VDISVLVCAVEDKVMRDNSHRVERHTDVLFIASAEVDLDKILGKLCIGLCIVKRMRTKLKIKRDNKLFKNLANLKYLSTTLINQTCMHEEIRAEKSTECWSSFGTEYFVFYSGIQKYKDRTASLPVVLYGCKIWSPTLNVNGRT